MFLSADHPPKLRFIHPPEGRLVLWGAPPLLTPGGSVLGPVLSLLSQIFLENCHFGAFGCVL